MRAFLKTFFLLASSWRAWEFRAPARAIFYNIISVYPIYCCTDCAQVAPPGKIYTSLRTTYTVADCSNLNGHRGRTSSISLQSSKKQTKIIFHQWNSSNTNINSSIRNHRDSGNWHFLTTESAAGAGPITTKENGSPIPLFQRRASSILYTSCIAARAAHTILLAKKGYLRV